MKNQDTTRELEQQWEQAVQEARENNSVSQPPDNERLRSAAGLHVKGRVRAGQNSTDVISSYCCTGHNCL